MKAAVVKSARCAIYTRKSTEHGLELEFNSLDAQRESCEAYIKSQTSVGWKSVPTRYDDPAYSGGSLERPALQQLITDIEAGLIDIVVVYKIDRLTRSLADFAKLVEVFDARTVSFVAVTQQFNTTTSMGRLTLNVLLSFAQFERELSSERVRDKVAASRKKGKWMGGNVPLGYFIKDKKLLIEPAGAKTVQYIFDRYLKLKSLQNLISDLNDKRLVTRIRPTANKPILGGKSFSYGPLAYLLKNRIYIGEIGHKGHWFPGEHEPIIERSIFDSVQTLLSNNSVNRLQKRINIGALLTGLLFDDRGNRMSPSYTTKRGVRYRFYVNSALLTGRKHEAGSVRRVSAPDLEKMVLAALRDRIGTDDGNDSDHDFVNKQVKRIVLHETKTEIALKKSSSESAAATNNDTLEIERPNRTTVSARIEADIDGPTGKPNLRLIQSVARAHAWLGMLLNGIYNSVEELADAINMDPRAVRNGLRMAFLAPDITGAILGDRPPIMTNLAQLQAALSLAWSEQRKSLKLLRFA